MYKCKNTLLLYFTFFILFSCNKDHLDTPNLSSIGNKKNIQGINKISDALKYLNTTFLQRNDNSNTATYSRNSNVFNAPLRISDIDTVYDFRLTEHKPLLKLVCLKENGYFLTSYLDLNINNAPPVLFYSENKFDLKDVNPGLIDYINSFAEGKIAQDKYLASNPSMKFDRLPDEIIDGLYKKHLKSGRVNPLLKTSWSQNREIDRFYQLYNGEEALVGCVPIAIGQVTFHYYYRNPNKPSSLTLDRHPFTHYPHFDFMKFKRATPETRNFLSMIGYYVDADYGLDATGAYTKDSKRFFDHMKIDSKYHRYYDSDIITESLNDNRPVILGGYSIRNKISWWNPAGWFGDGYTYSSGHAWVCDGYFYSKPSYYDDTLFLHMNWGWGNGHNGWNHHVDWNANNSTSNPRSNNYYSKTRSDNYRYKKDMLTTKPRFPWKRKY
ncbi:C10 family peptidase [Ichthyobacterium seriolicida]|uniref:Pyrogenic exotoxin B n=1 Tax=Ichthyobacterium seriolicida TaxID=242600 RepID=A0A1J1DYQ1_9FLAO|nr:C10 family peptidase [Ichthyobacterium seriolicida]BAV95025.1 pyrogenic exotoxin B [Ichthyobacterium seriolicida]